MAFPSLSFCIYGVLVLLATFCGGYCKIYDRCELTRELKKVHRIPESEVATWVCLARHESEFNTSAINQVSGDHGLFQISQLFWCSPPGEGHACGLSCDQLKDEDIKDDVICARRIYREHKRLSGDGFNAWVVYRQHCSDGRAAQYTEGCSAHANTQEPDTNNEVKQDASKPDVFKANPSTSSTPATPHAGVSTLTTRVSYPHVNNIGTHSSTSSTPATPHAGVNTLAKRVSYQHVNNIAKHVSNKFAGNNANAYNVAKFVSAKPTPAAPRATNYVSVKQTHTSLKPVSNMPHKGFRIINGIVTYY